MTFKSVNWMIFQIKLLKPFQCNGICMKLKIKWNLKLQQSTMQSRKKNQSKSTVKAKNKSKGHQIINFYVWILQKLVRFLYVRSAV